MFHIFFIHSSFDEDLGCFCVLAIVNSAAVNIEVHVSFGIMVFSQVLCPIVGLLGHMVIQSETSQKEKKQISYNNTYIWNL